MSKYIDANKLKAILGRRKKLAQGMGKAITRFATNPVIEFAISEYNNLIGIINSLQKEHPSLPSNLDEAALQWWDSVKFYSDLSGTPINAFKAGAKWMAEQGETIEQRVMEFLTGSCDFAPGINVVFFDGEFKKGDKVIVQIRKK